MSSIIERLTEGVVNRDMKAEGHALLKKWERTGLLEGLTNERQKNSMARLLENQAKELLREASTMAMPSSDVEGFASVAFPIVRRVFAGLIANDLVSVQPMSLPSGLIFFLDFTFNSTRMDGTEDKSIYGGDEVGSEITGGVDLVGALKQDFAGPRTVAARGYAYASPTGSGAPTEVTKISCFSLTSSTNAQRRDTLIYDPDILSLSASAGKYTALSVVVAKEAITGSQAGQPADYDNLGAFTLSGITALTNVASTAVQIKRLTQLTTLAGKPDPAGGYVQFVLFGTDDSSGIKNIAGTAANADGSLHPSITITYPIKDNIVDANAVGAVKGTQLWGLENNTAIPEIDIKVDSIAVTAQTKKLKAKWTPELGQDLNAYHNLDAEVELTSILSEQIALEIDREILADLVNGAKASTYYWSRSPGLFVDRVTGNEVGAASKAPDFTGTVSEWYETLIETINDVSAQIHRKTLRGGANFIVCGPEVANILEFTAGFRASVTNDDESGSVGAVKVGSLSKKFDVIVDPYFIRNVILVGRRGSSFLESGYVYAPYVPLQTTPTIFGPEDFVPRKGVMTRYAKQMVRPDMYGLVIVRGLLGEDGGA
tara:strand:+ start:19323 stop:21122 length:1800 start_codon:yes stop_codon:yes gene_type:complete